MDWEFNFFKMAVQPEVTFSKWRPQPFLDFEKLKPFLNLLTKFHQIW